MINKTVIPLAIAVAMTTLLIVGLFSTPQHIYAQIPGITTPPSSQEQQQQSQSTPLPAQTTMNGYTTYENSQFGFKILLPQF